MRACCSERICIRARVTDVSFAYLQRRRQQGGSCRGTCAKQPFDPGWMESMILESMLYLVLSLAMFYA